MKLIEEYEQFHADVWPEIKDSIRSSGVLDMQIYRFSNRLFMIMDVNDDFSFDREGKSDETNIKVQQWEQLMWKFQQSIPGSKPGDKWVLMKKIFDL